MANTYQRDALQTSVVFDGEQVSVIRLRETQ